MIYLHLHFARSRRQSGSIRGSGVWGGGGEAYKESRDIGEKLAPKSRFNF